MGHLQKSCQNPSLARSDSLQEIRGANVMTQPSGEHQGSGLMYKDFIKNTPQTLVICLHHRSITKADRPIAIAVDDLKPIKQICNQHHSL
jgi:hypothetical protein